MVKLLLTGIWVCIVTLGAVYFAVTLSAPSAPVDEELARRDKLELVSGESVTVPLIANGEVIGYFIGKVSFMMDKQKIAGIKLPMAELASDQLFTLLIGNKMIDISKTSSFDVAEFKARIKANLNEKLGDTIIDEVLVEQLDYLAKSDIRTNGNPAQKRTAAPLKIVQDANAAAEPAKAASH